MTNNERNIKQIGDAIARSCAEARENGIWIGLQTAGIIARMWQTNHMLKEPRSVETLSRWSNLELAKLEAKCSPPTHPIRLEYALGKPDEFDVVADSIEDLREMLKDHTCKIQITDLCT